MKIQDEIPKEFKLFGTTIKVKWENDRMNDKRQYGESDYARTQIVLSTTIGTEKLSDDRMKDTFYHEKVHIILDSMNRRELSNDEEFVDVFAKLLRQSDITAKY